MLVDINGWAVNPLNVTYVNPIIKEGEKVTEIHFGPNHCFWTSTPSCEEIVKIISDGLIAIQKGRFSRKRKKSPKKQLGGTEK